MPARLVDLADVIVALAASLPAVMEQSGTAVRCQTLDVTAPVEVQLGRDGNIRAQLPRGRMATGFDPPLGRLCAHFDTRAA